jgi:hypothetical protein
MQIARTLSADDGDRLTRYRAIQSERLDAVIRSLSEDDLYCLVARWDSEHGLESPSSRMQYKRGATRRARRNTFIGVVLAVVLCLAIRWASEMSQEREEKSDDSAEMSYLRNRAQSDKSLAIAIQAAEDLVEPENKP